MKSYLEIFYILINLIVYVTNDYCTGIAICRCEIKKKNQENVSPNALGDNPAFPNFPPCNNNTQGFSIAEGVNVNEYELLCDSLDVLSKTSALTQIDTNNTQPTFTLRLKYQCNVPPPKSEGYSTGSILFILFFTGLLVYLGIGMSFNFFLMGARGIEMVPHLNFWKDLPSLVTDGVKFLQNGMTVQPSDISSRSPDSYDAI